MSETNLDSIPGCIAELTECNREVASFAHDWASRAGELKRCEKRYERLRRSAMRGTSGRNADERAAVADVAISEIEPQLAERIEELIETVERYKRQFEAIERRSSNAQSILKTHREGSKFEDYVPREALQMAGRAG